MSHPLFLFHFHMVLFFFCSTCVMFCFTPLTMAIIITTVISVVVVLVMCDVELGHGATSSASQCCYLCFLPYLSFSPPLSSPPYPTPPRPVFSLLHHNHRLHFCHPTSACHLFRVATDVVITIFSHHFISSSLSYDITHCILQPLSHPSPLVTPFL